MLLVQNECGYVWWTQISDKMTYPTVSLWYCSWYSWWCNYWSFLSYTHCSVQNHFSSISSLTSTWQADVTLHSICGWLWSLHGLKKYDFVWNHVSVFQISSPSLPLSFLNFVMILSLPYAMKAIVQYNMYILVCVCMCIYVQFVHFTCLLSRKLLLNTRVI